MAFEPARSFLFSAARQFHLEPQALSGIVCEQAKACIEEKFAQFKDLWRPNSFSGHTLTIKTTDSSARSALYMRQMEVLETIQTECDLPKEVKELKII